MSKQKLLNAVAVAAIAGAFAGTAGISAADAGADVQISIGGGSSGGLYYITAAGMARVIERHADGVVATAQVSSGGAENTRLMEQGALDCGLMTADTPYAAYNALDPFQDEQMQNIRYVTRGYSSTLQVIVNADGDVETVADLSGKRVGLAVGQTPRVWFPPVAAAYGLEMTEITPFVLGIGELMTSMRDDNIDAAVYWGGAPTGAVMDLEAGKDIRFLSISAEAIEEVIENEPYMIPLPLAAGVYDSVEEETSSLGIPNVLVCRADLDDEIVYQITRALMEHNEELAEVHPLAGQFGPENAGKSVVIPVHDGALRYYEEAGIAVEG